MRRDKEQRIKETLAKNHDCYVLITCDGPTEQGQMQIEMTYEGDATVASYMLQGAQSYMNEQEEKLEQAAIFELPQDEAKDLPTERDDREETSHGHS